MIVHGGKMRIEVKTYRRRCGIDKEDPYQYVAWERSQLAS